MSLTRKIFFAVVLACVLALSTCEPLGARILLDGKSTPNAPFTVFAQAVATKDGSPKADLCPGGEYYCSTGTCCSVGNGYFGCCQYNYATCCTQPYGCCPSGYRCSGEYCVLN